MARHKEQEDKSFGKRNVAALKQYREGEACSVCCRERVVSVVFAGFWNRINDAMERDELVHKGWWPQHCVVSAVFSAFRQQDRPGQQI